MKTRTRCCKNRNRKQRRAFKNSETIQELKDKVSSALHSKAETKMDNRTKGNQKKHPTYNRSSKREKKKRANQHRMLPSTESRIEVTERKSPPPNA